jgi:hypothetical protein
MLWCREILRLLKLLLLSGWQTREVVMSAPHQRHTVCWKMNGIFVCFSSLLYNICSCKYIMYNIYLFKTGFIFFVYNVGIRTVLCKGLVVWEIRGCGRISLRHKHKLGVLNKQVLCVCVYIYIYTAAFDVCGSVHHITIHKEKSNKMQQYIKIFIIPYLYEAQHV